MINTSLERAIFQEIQDNINSMTLAEARYWVENDAICSAGSVTGLIYYKDTVEFFDKNEDEILDPAKEHEFEYSIVQNGMIQFKNTMTWFAFEVLKDPVFENHIDEFSFSREDED